MSKSWEEVYSYRKDYIDETECNSALQCLGMNDSDSETAKQLWNNQAQRVTMTIAKNELKNKLFK